MLYPRAKKILMLEEDDSSISKTHNKRYNKTIEKSDKKISWKKKSKKRYSSERIRDTEIR